MAQPTEQPPDPPIVPPLNPTGSCVAPNDGAREGLPMLEAGDVWLPDCLRFPRREYWRVFLRPSGTAYIVPDPSLAPQYYVDACANLQNPLYEIVSRHSTCGFGSQTDATNMTPADAFKIAHYYHSVFSFNYYPPGMVPEAYIGDVLDACDLETSDDSVEFHLLCTRLRQQGQGGADAGIVPKEGQAGADLAFRLNQLYGLDTPRVTFSIAPELCGLPTDPATCSGPGPRYFYDPRTATCEERAFGSCPSLSDFADQESCRQACADRAHFCQHCFGTSCSTTDCTACPLTSPSSTTSCSVVGLECHYALRCGPMCTCQPDGTWTCISNLC